MVCGPASAQVLPDGGRGAALLRRRTPAAPRGSVALAADPGAGAGPARDAVRPHAARRRADPCGAPPGRTGAGDPGRGRPRPPGRAVRGARPSGAGGPAGLHDGRPGPRRPAAHGGTGDPRPRGRRHVEPGGRRRRGRPAGARRCRGRLEPAAGAPRPRRRSSSARCCSGSSCRSAHPLADEAEVPVSGLGDESAVMFPWSPFAGIWQRTVDHLLPTGARPGQVVVEPDLINSPEAMLRAVAAGSGVAPGILGVAEHMDVERHRRAAARSPAAPRPRGRLAPAGASRGPAPRRPPRRRRSRSRRSSSPPVPDDVVAPRIGRSADSASRAGPGGIDVRRPRPAAVGHP